MQNIPSAAFSIVNYYFDKINIDLTKRKSNELKLSIEPNGNFKSAENTFELLFVLKIFETDSSEPFITIQCRGVFKFDNPITINDIPDYFYNNSIAILFPYLRGYVSLVTTQANIPGIILPTLNLSAFGEELKKNTVE